MANKKNNNIIKIAIFITALMMSGLYCHADDIYDEYWHELAKDVIVEKTDFDFKSTQVKEAINKYKNTLIEKYSNLRSDYFDDTSVLSYFLYNTFAEKPVLKKFDTVPTKDWISKWNEFKKALLLKAKEKGLNDALLDKCLKTIRKSDNSKEKAMIPVGAYLTKSGNDNVWIIICKWAFTDAPGEYSADHICGWAIQENDQKEIAFFTCM